MPEQQRRQRPTPEKRVEETLGRPGNTPAQLTRSVEAMTELVGEVRALSK